MDKKTRKKKKTVKAVKGVEKAVKRAVKKGVMGEIVEAAVKLFEVFRIQGSSVAHHPTLVALSIASS
jgi:hypothetical protein